MSEELFISVNTVRFHLANVYQKLGVSNRTEAANYYLRQDLAPNPQTKLL
jgi:DNA-binding CsgD family transcriptional regulator